jgi:hypothetical protein
LVKETPDLTPFSTARFSNTGSMTRHGAQEALVKNATTARWVLSIEWKDEGLVEAWIRPVSVGAAESDDDDVAPEAMVDEEA